MGRLIPTTFAALAVAMLAILPGAAFMFAYESRMGAYGLSLPDRIVRFLAASAVLHALAAGVTYQLYRTQIHNGRLARGQVNAYLVEVLALSYILLPYLAGWLVGTGRHNSWPVLRRFGKSTLHPRAWDHAFADKPTMVIRMRLKSGDWIAGIFGATTDGRVSYASGYKEDGDLYLAETLAVDRQTGEIEFDEQGFPNIENAAILISWNEVEYAQMIYL